MEQGEKCSVFSLTLAFFFFFPSIMLHCRTKFSDYHAVSYFVCLFPKFDDSVTLMTIRTDLSPALRGLVVIFCNVHSEKWLHFRVLPT